MSCQVRRIVAAVPALLVALACGPGNGDSAAGTLPDQIHGLQLAESRAGDEAAETVDRMHDREVAPNDSYVGYYGSDDLRAVLYVSRFRSPDEAGAELESMVAGIGRGSSGFAHHRLITVRDLDVHSVFGQGQVHYFWADGNTVTWLASPPPLARAAVAELLGVLMSEIPGLMQSLPDTAGGAAR